MSGLFLRDKHGNKIPFPSIKGENGNQMFVRFSAYADGTDMSDKWDSERGYMGIAFAASPPTDKAAYQWIALASIALGRYAELGSDERYLFYVGNGTGEDNRSNALTMDEDGNFHVAGEITFGEDNFSPREAVAEQKEYIDKQIEEHTVTADRVTDLLPFMGEYHTSRIIRGTVNGTGANSITIPVPDGFDPTIVILHAGAWTGTEANTDGHIYMRDLHIYVRGMPTWLTCPNGFDTQSQYSYEGHTKQPEFYCIYRSGIGEASYETDAYVVGIVDFGVGNGCFTITTSTRYKQSERLSINGFSDPVKDDRYTKYGYILIG